MLLCRPPSSSPYGVTASQFCGGFADYVDELLALPGDMLLCGDLNCAGDASGMDPLVDDLLTSRQLVQHVDEPTHRDGNMLDLVITAETSTLSGKLTVTDPGICDHKLIAADLQVGRLKPILRQYRYRKVNTVDVAVFADRLRRQPVY